MKWKWLLLILVSASAFGAETKTIVYSEDTKNTSPTNLNYRATSYRSYGDGSTPGAIDLYSIDGAYTLTLEINPSATATVNLRGPLAPFSGFMKAVVTTTTNMTLTEGTYNATADVLTDDTYDGIPISGKTAGESLTQWDLVRYHTDGKWYKADADGASFPAFEAKGIAVATASADAAIKVLTKGVVRNDGWTWTVGGAIYLSATAGTWTQTAPSTSGHLKQQIGWALSDDEAFFDFSMQSVVNP